MKLLNLHHIYIPSIVFLCCLLNACTKQTTSQDKDISSQLFDKCVEITEAYIDSIQHAPDSATINRMASHFDEKMTSLIYQFPANTDLLLSEEENDSLIRMHKRLVSTEVSRLASLYKSTTDSITTSDSIPTH